MGITTKIQKGTEHVSFCLQANVFAVSYDKRGQRSAEILTSEIYNNHSWIRKSNAAVENAGSFRKLKSLSIFQVAEDTVKKVSPFVLEKFVKLKACKSK